MAANAFIPDVAFDPHIIAFTGANTRNIEDLTWTHVKTTLLLIPNNTHHYAVAFAAYGIRNFGDLLALNVGQIDALTYANAGGNEVPFLLGDCGRIKCLISMYNDISRMLGANVDLRTVTRDDFDAYRVGSYRPDHPLGIRHAAHGPGPRAPPIGTTPAEQFCRAIKKDKDHYSEFSDEKQFDNFRRVTESVARTHGTMDVLNPNFQVRGPDQSSAS